MAHLTRALHHFAESGFAPEADSAFTLSRATRWSEPLARGTRHLGFRHARSRLEYNVRAGNQQRTGWLVDRGGVEARVWDEEGGAPRWKLALFDAPPMVEGPPPHSPATFFYVHAMLAQAHPRSPLFKEGCAHWPVEFAPDAHCRALATLVDRVRGAPHGGFELPQCEADPYGCGPRIQGPLAAWRAANPGALVANVKERLDLTDADFVHLVGIKALNMAECANPGLTDAAFAHLRGLHTLWMTGCTQLTDGAFVHLRGLHTLRMGHCSQPAITDAAFAHLRGIQRLGMSGCDQATITGAAFAHLRGVRVLHMSNCSPAAIAAASALGLPV